MSQNYGNGKTKRVKASFKTSIKLGLYFSVFFAVIIIGFRSSFAGLFAKEDLVLKAHVMNAIMVYSISIIPWAIFQMVIGLFTGLGKTKYNLIITLSRLYAFRLPCIIVLSKVSSLNEYSVWIAMLLSNILTAVFALELHYYEVRKMHKLERV